VCKVMEPLDNGGAVTGQQDSAAGTPLEEVLPSGGDHGSCCSMGENRTNVRRKKIK
jgi:hypothetical protein